MAEFYKKTVIVADDTSFKIEVYNTRFTISAQFLADKFELSSSKVSIFTYLYGNPDIKRIHWNH